MKISTHIKIDTKRIKSLKKIGKTLSSYSSDVGFFDGKIHSGTKDKSTIAGIALINHEGRRDGHSPARPFMPTDSTGKKFIPELAMNIRSVFRFRESAKSSLFTLGRDIARSVKQEIIDFSSPGNSPVTVRLKGGIDNPLIDTGEMLQGVENRVVKGK